MKKVDALSHFGTQKALAEALGIAQAAVAQWGDQVPQRRAFEIERLTAGKLKADYSPPTPSTPPSPT